MILYKGGNFIQRTIRAMTTLFNAASDPQDSQAFIIDGDQANFMADVLDASKEIPVLVDFWATWCGPCKTLTPALERVIRAQKGRVKLVKIDVDQNRELVAQLTRMGIPLQSVPTVVAFWQGQIADTFSGALPESELKRFIEGLLKLAGSSAPGEMLITEAKTLLEEGNASQAAQYFQAALQEAPDKPEAWGGLARALLALGEEQQAEQLLTQVPPALANHIEITGAHAALALAQEGKKAQAAMAGLEARLASNPNDHAARYDLASALNASGARAEAAASLLEIIKRDKDWNESAARLQLLKFFEAWGLDDPATMAARRKLSALLFS